MLFKVVKMIMYMTGLVLRCRAHAEGQDGGRPGWAGYAEAPGLRGWLSLRRDPRDWSAAAADCLGEDAALASPWSPAFTATVGALAAREGLPMLYSGARATLPFLAVAGGGAGSAPGELVRCSAFLADGSSTDVPCSARLPYVCFAAEPGRAPVLSLEPAALVRRETCIMLHADGSERAVSCSERLPFVCYAPLPTAPAPSPCIAPSDLATSPTPLSLRPTIETVTSRTLRNIPTTSSSPITNPTKTTATPVPTTAPSAARTSSTAISTPMTTTLAHTTRPTSVPTTSTVLVPTTTFSTTPSDGTSSTTAPPLNVCEEIGLVEYQWEEVTEQCYRFHPYGATWPVANETCTGEGAALAVANSREEAMLFTRLLLQHLKSGIRDAKFIGGVALGFYWDQEWKTVDGTPLEQTGYAKWWPGWPRHQELAPWGFMEHTGRLENYSSTLTTPFICEGLR